MIIGKGDWFQHAVNTCALLAHHPIFLFMVILEDPPFPFLIVICMELTSHFTSRVGT